MLLNGSGLFLSPKVPSKKRSISLKWVGPVSLAMVRAVLMEILERPKGAGDRRPAK